MIFWTAAFATTLICLWLAQAFLVWAFARTPVPSREIESTARSGDEKPVSVILCVRGRDPSLVQCLRAIRTQHYSNYELIVIGDHADDLGLQLAAEFAAEPHPISMRTVSLNQHEVSTERSLKCSCLLRGVAEANPNSEVLVFVDADTIPAGDWLGQLVAPFESARVGATTAFRWYEPISGDVGTCTRYIWNAAAIVQMWWYRIAWGGSLAIRRSAIEKAELTKLWSQSFCEDTLVSKAIARHGWRLEYVQNLFVCNRERCDLKGLAPWISRQLLTTRLYHPAWWPILIHAYGTTSSVIGVLVMMVLHALRQDYAVVAALGGLLLAYQLGLVLLVRLIVGRVERGLQYSHAEVAPQHLSFWQTWKHVLISQFLYPWSTTQAALRREIEWRQIKYSIRFGKVQMHGYAPFVVNHASLGPESTANSKSL